MDKSVSSNKESSVPFIFDENFNFQVNTEYEIIVNRDGEELKRRNLMSYEIDFLAVGEESKSGDAIALRFGDFSNIEGDQKVVVIDGGFSDSGEKLLDSIKKHYGADKIDLVVSTHPDADHIGGLHYILDNAEVKELWMHKPWEHIEGIADKFKDGRVTDASLGERLKESLVVEMHRL